MKQLILCLSIFLSSSFTTAVYAVGDLSQSETDTLLFIREEEKLARDVYQAMEDKWNHRVFANIKVSEQKHMDSMLKMIDLYGLVDPVGDNPPGVFSDGSLGALYTNLVAQGSEGDATLLDAFYVGAYIEDLDMSDLAIAISETDEYPLQRSYSNLLAGSCNHLRAFVGHIMAQGETYQPEFISQQVYDECIGDINDVPVSNGGFSINPGLNDVWYYPKTNGQGFSITVFPGVKRVFMVWFTYGVDLPDPTAATVIGDPGQRWLAAEGPYSGSLAELEIYSMFGGLFDNEAADPEMKSDGSILLQFDNCDSGTVEYDLPSAGLSGMVPIQRVNSNNVARCLREEQKKGGAGDSAD